VHTLRKKQVVIFAPALSLLFLLQLCDFIWNCRVFHQLVEMVFFVIMIQAITMMRKLIGRLQGLTPVDRNVAAVTSFQKIMVYIAFPIFAIEICVSSWGLAVQIAKTFCWGCLLCNMASHFGSYLRGINVVFGTVESGLGTEKTVSRAARTGKARKAKSNLRLNIILMVVSSVGVIGMLVWRPQANDGYSCVLRTTEVGYPITRLAFGFFCGVLSHANWLQTLLVFTTKKRRRASLALAVGQVKPSPNIISRRASAVQSTGAMPLASENSARPAETTTHSAVEPGPSPLFGT
jgi:hypothetical protein